MMYRFREWALIIGFVLISVDFTTSAFAGQTKNNVIVDCDKIPDDAATCLACNIYHEARSESHPGLWLVAWSTKNRVDGNLYPAKNAGPKVKKAGYKDPFCQVVYEQRRDKKTRKWTPMYSWTRDGKHDRVLNLGLWLDSFEVAKMMIDFHNGVGKHKLVDITYGCQWYHRFDVDAYWKGDYHPTVRIGAHQCYSQNESVYLTKLGNMLPQIGMMRIMASPEADNLVPVERIIDDGQTD